MLNNWNEICCKEEKILFLSLILYYKFNVYKNIMNL